MQSGPRRADSNRVGRASAHQLALVHAYELIETAQDHDVAAAVELLTARARHWPDVVLLLHFARSLADRGAGLDDGEHVRAMLRAAEEHGDPALIALALATTAHRAAVSSEARHAASGADPVVRAVVLLDSAESLVVHRVAAHLEVANVLHTLGLWPLARQQFELVEALFAEAGPAGPWADVLRRQRRVMQINGLDLALDEACARAEIGDWKTARRTARDQLPRALAVLDDDWPPTWAATVHAFAALLAALAGRDCPADRRFVAEQARDPEHDCPLALLDVADAFRAHQAGDRATAARLAEACRTAIGPNVPVHVRLLALSLATHDSPAPAAALEYIHALLGMRWNSRASRLASMRAAIDSERRRVEHEMLRDQVFVDDLTGLGNRRAYSAYLERVRQNGVSPPTVRRRPKRARPERVVVMMIDVDHFKNVNDSFGHELGDQVLRRIGRLLAGLVRPSDLAARLGGDEFVVVMTQDTEGVGRARAAEILDAVRDHPWHELAEGLSVSISLGLHIGGPAELGEMQAQADRHLYEAKRGGRGRISGAP